MLCEEPVIVSGTVPEPMAGSVKGKDRNNDGLHVVCQGREFVTDGFRHVEGTLNKMGGILKVGEAEVICLFLNDGYNSLPPAFQLMIKQGKCMDFQGF